MPAIYFYRDNQLTGKTQTHSTEKINELLGASLSKYHGCPLSSEFFPSITRDTS